jgi:hypothetical protein
MLGRLNLTKILECSFPLPIVFWVLLCQESTRKRSIIRKLLFAIQPNTLSSSKYALSETIHLRQRIIQSKHFLNAVSWIELSSRRGFSFMSYTDRIKCHELVIWVQEKESGWSHIWWVWWFIIIIISLWMSPLLGHRPSLWITHKEMYDDDVEWWLLVGICWVFVQKFVHNDGPVRMRIIVVQNPRIFFLTNLAFFVEFALLSHRSPLK